ncbi:MAG: HlyC/CorC family transporter [Nocardiopsis sp. BM-2018]|nr:MAG: HlyC/CorC family transporter [Nocardiopsis sp. BM-2018]
MAAALLLVNLAGGEGLFAGSGGAAAASAGDGGAAGGGPDPGSWAEVFTPAVLFGFAILLALSAFFSASEIAYFSLHKTRLRSMRESPRPGSRLAARLMEHPGGLLTSILMANSITNVLLSVVIAHPVEIYFDQVLSLPPAVSYPLAVALCTALLVFFGEIFPKVLVVRNAEGYASAVSAPLFLVDKLLTPVRDGMIAVTGFFFRVTRFSEVRPAPFITDEEFKTMLTEGEATGVIEKDERQMIQGILDLDQQMVRDLLVPRREVIALPVTATTGEAIAKLREHEYARMPVYEDDLDHITGILYAKELIPSFARGEFEAPIAPLQRKALFVPETMTVARFVKTAQRLHTHLAIVVDEYGGTEGIVTLQDALREVVGDITGEDDAEEPLYRKLGDGVYELDGAMPLDELEELAGVEIDDDEHATVAGFLMDRFERILEVGDEAEHLGVVYRVEEMDGKRVARVRMQAPPAPAREHEE